MGTYVEFRPCGVTGVIGQLLTEIDGYARWYAADYAEDGTREVLDLMHMLRERGAQGLESVPPELHWAIDQSHGVLRCLLR